MKLNVVEVNELKLWSFYKMNLMIKQYRYLYGENSSLVYYAKGIRATTYFIWACITTLVTSIINFILLFTP